MAGKTRRGRSPRYSLIVPGDWVAIDLAGLTGTSAGDAVARLRAGTGRSDLAPVAPDALRMLDDILGAARRNGAFQVYLFSRTVAGRQAVASLTVAAASPETPAEHDDLDLLALRYRASAEPDPATTPQISIERTLAGEAVRVEQRRTVHVDGRGDTVAVHEVHYAVPIPGDERLLLLTFSTPNVAAADAFAAVFDVIAGGLMWAA